MKIQLTSTKIINWVCVLMIMVMVAMLFTPYWELEETERVDGEKVTVTNEYSINDYVWFPREQKNLTKAFEKLYEDKDDFWINDMVLMPALVLLVGVIVGIISLWYSNVPFSALLALFLGGLGVYGYGTIKEFSILNAPVTLHLIIAAATAAIGLAGVVWYIVKSILNKKKA